MEALRYKSFVWPQNPHTYREEFLREPQYITENKVTVYTGMGPMKQVITGEGVFFGEGAFDWFRQLTEVFADSHTGMLNHPLWGARRCYFTRLALTQEPKEDHVSYSFCFHVVLSDGTVPK